MDRDTSGRLKDLVCLICERGCRLGPGRAGACGCYEWRDGRVAEVRPDHYLAADPISIETMPLLHYFPGHKFLQVSTTGCNFDCNGCFATVIAKDMPRHSRALVHLSPAQVVDRAVSEDCLGIAFLMNDPLASWPTFLRLASLARDRGLKVGCASNAYFTSESLADLVPVLDFINVGLKGFSDQSYQACGASGGLGPVMRNLERLVAAGVHVEASVMFARDSEPELRSLARWLASVSPGVPLQLMRFIPIEGAELVREPGVRQAEDLCRELRGVLRHVYLFNTPGTPYLDTVCPACGRPVIRREFYGPMGARLLDRPAGDPRCGACGARLGVVGTIAAEAHREDDFKGGYPFTRALEMVEAMLVAMGVRRKRDLVRAWEHLLEPGGLAAFHRQVQHPRTYIEAVRRFGGEVGAPDQAEHLASYLEAKLKQVAAAVQDAPRRPRVYYAMAKPLFYLNGARLENQLVECAGGISLNKELPPGGRPGRNLSVARLNELDPEIMVISAFLSNSTEDFRDECRELGVTAQAVTENRIFVHPAPGWDFGSPRWVLGLMYLARVFHPKLCAYDVLAEAQVFYRLFYGQDFRPCEVNRSFAKPSGKWRWRGRGDQASLVRVANLGPRPLPGTNRAGLDFS